MEPDLRFIDVGDFAVVDHHDYYEYNPYLVIDHWIEPDGILVLDHHDHHSIEDHDAHVQLQRVYAVLAYDEHEYPKNKINIFDQLYKLYNIMYR